MKKLIALALISSHWFVAYNFVMSDKAFGNGNTTFEVKGPWLDLNPAAEIIRKDIHAKSVIITNFIEIPLAQAEAFKANSK